MGRNFIEKRIIRAGVRLCDERLERYGEPIRPEHLRDLKVPTFSPFLRGLYIAIGLGLMGFGLWLFYELGNMALAMLLMLAGAGHIAFGAYGWPRRVGDLGERADLADLTAEIVSEFVKRADRRREEAGRR